MKKDIYYIAHSISWDIENNKKDIIKIANELHKNLWVIPFAPYLLYLNYLNDNIPEERELGILANKTFFEKKYFDKLFICWKTFSKGVFEEYKLAEKLNIPIIFSMDYEIEDNLFSKEDINWILYEAKKEWNSIYNWKLNNPKSKDDRTLEQTIAHVIIWKYAEKYYLKFFNSNNDNIKYQDIITYNNKRLEIKNRNLQFYPNWTNNVFYIIQKIYKKLKERWSTILAEEVFLFDYKKDNNWKMLLRPYLKYNWVKNEKYKEYKKSYEELKAYIISNNINNYNIKNYFNLAIINKEDYKKINKNENNLLFKAFKDSKNFEDFLNYINFYGLYPSY